MKKILLRAMFGLVILMGAIASTGQVGEAEATHFPVPEMQGDSDPIFTNFEIAALDMIFSDGFYIDYYPVTKVKNATGNQFTSIGLDLTFNCPDNFEQACGGMLAGVLTTNKDARWFVYSGNGVNCHRGQAVWKDDAGETIGCLGRPGDLVGIKQWSRVQVVGAGDNGSGVVSIRGQRVATVDARNTYGLHAISSQFWPSNGREELQGGFWQKQPHFRDGEWLAWGWYTTDGGSDGVAATFVAVSDCPKFHGFRDSVEGQKGIWYAGSTLGDKKLYGCNIDPLF